MEEKLFFFWLPDCITSHFSVVVLVVGRLNQSYKFFLMHHLTFCCFCLVVGNKHFSAVCLAFLFVYKRMKQKKIILKKLINKLQSRSKKNLLNGPFFPGENLWLFFLHTDYLTCFDSIWFVCFFLNLFFFLCFSLFSSKSK